MVFLSILPEMSRPLKDYNYQDRNPPVTVKQKMTALTQSEKSTKDGMQLLNKPKESQKDASEEFRTIIGKDTSQSPDQKVNKITLQEYRDRAKAKSPIKPTDTSGPNAALVASGLNNAEKDLKQKKAERIIRVDTSNDKQNPPSGEHSIAKSERCSDPVRKRSERAMSVDELSEMSCDIANMSIDDSSDVVGKPGNKPREESRVVEKKPHHENKLSMKKAVSSSQCSSQTSPSGLKPSSKSYSSLPSAKPKTETAERSTMNAAVQGKKLDSGSCRLLVSKDVKMMDIPLSERIKMKNSGSQPLMITTKESTDVVKAKPPAGLQSSKAGSASNIIDLTDDDDVNNEPVKPKTTQFGTYQSGKMASFQSINKQSGSSQDTGKVSTGHSQQWTQMRGQPDAGIKTEFNSFKPASHALQLSLQEDVKRRNELNKLLDKQKVQFTFERLKS